MRSAPSTAIRVASVAATLIASGIVIWFASRKNSVTFDEPFMVAAGARAIETGDYSMGWDQPPAMLYAYGAAIHLGGLVRKWRGEAAIRYPSEEGTIVLPPELAAAMPRSVHVAGPVPRWGLYNRYDYLRAFFFQSGNDPEWLAATARIVAILVTLGLGVAIAAFVWLRFGFGASVLAVALYAFLPEVLAHGGIAYNDMPFALAFFLGIWLIDEFVRSPSVVRSIGMGAAIGLALCTKFSALSLGPVALLLALLEFFIGRRDRRWLIRLAGLAMVGLAATAFVLLIAYRGDVTLLQFREGIREQLGHAGSGHGVPTLLLGQLSDSGFWYFFPVSISLKLPVAMQLLALSGLLTLALSANRRQLLDSARPIIAGGVVFLAVLMSSRLNIGVRYALPLLPLIVILTAVGLFEIWRKRDRLFQASIAVLVIASAASALAWYPWFLSYVTEYVPPASRATAYVDSNSDWGQGLLALRDFMHSAGIEGVYLAYFGSALPEGYGINYFPLPSWRPLPDKQQPMVPWDWVVVSNTHLRGLYETGDPFARLRLRTPDRILAKSLFLYRVR